MWDPSSLTRGWTHIRCAARQILNHETTREDPKAVLFSSRYWYLPHELDHLAQPRQKVKFLEWCFWGWSILELRICNEVNSSSKYPTSPSHECKIETSVKQRRWCCLLQSSVRGSQRSFILRNPSLPPAGLTVKSRLPPRPTCEGPLDPCSTTAMSDLPSAWALLFLEHANSSTPRLVPRLFLSLATPSSFYVNDAFPGKQVFSDSVSSS